MINVGRKPVGKKKISVRISFKNEKRTGKEER